MRKGTTKNILYCFNYSIYENLKQLKFLLRGENLKTLYDGNIKICIAEPLLI